MKTEPATAAIRRWLAADAGILLIYVGELAVGIALHYREFLIYAAAIATVATVMDIRDTRRRRRTRKDIK